MFKGEERMLQIGDLFVICKTKKHKKGIKKQPRKPYRWLFLARTKYQVPKQSLNNDWSD